MGDSIIYGLGNFLLKATQIFVLPLILFYLEKDQFGKLDYFLNIKNILLVVFGWGILTSIFKYSSNNEGKDSSPYNGFLAVLTISLIAFFINYFLFFFVESIREYWGNFIFVLTIASFGAFLTIPLGVYRQQLKPTHYILLNLILLIFLSNRYIL